MHSESPLSQAISAHEETVVFNAVAALSLLASEDMASLAHTQRTFPHVKTLNLGLAKCRSLQSKDFIDGGKRYIYDSYPIFCISNLYSPS